MSAVVRPGLAVLTAAVIAIVGGCSPSEIEPDSGPGSLLDGGSPAVRAYLTRTDYEVYGAIIDYLLERSSIDDCVLVNRDLIEISKHYPIRPTDSWKGASPRASTVADLLAQHETTLPLSNRIVTKHRHWILPRVDLSLLDTPRYSRCLSTLFSRVGFDDQRSEALVWGWSYCGSLCGQGGFWVLHRKGGRWRVTYFDGRMIS